MTIPLLSKDWEEAVQAIAAKTIYAAYPKPQIADFEFLEQYHTLVSLISILKSNPSEKFLLPIVTLLSKFIYYSSRLEKILAQGGIDVLLKIARLYPESDSISTILNCVQHIANKGVAKILMLITIQQRNIGLLWWNLAQ